MARIQAVATAPGNGSVRRPNAARFDLVGLEAAIEAAVCRAWQEEMGRKKGDRSMSAAQERKPAEMRPQQASQATDGAPVGTDVSTAGDLCQEVLAQVLASVEEKAVAAYQMAVAEAESMAGESGRMHAGVASVQTELAQAASQAQKQEEADEAALHEARARAMEALAPYIRAGVVGPEEAEEHLEGALYEAREQLQARRREAQLRLAALQAEVDQLQAREGELQANTATIKARLAQLRSLPCIAALERACREKEARRREAAQAAVRLLETAPWHELSWQKRLTPRTEQVVALASQDQGVFEALVERLGGELERVDATGRPGLGWSVVRAIEALEMERLFPNLEARRAELAQAARSYHRERQSGPPLADKIVSLASRWGARVAGG